MDWIINGVTGFAQTDWFILILIIGCFIAIFQEVGMSGYLSFILGCSVGFATLLFSGIVPAGMTLLGLLIFLFGIMFKKRFVDGQTGGFR